MFACVRSTGHAVRSCGPVVFPVVELVVAAGNVVDLSEVAGDEVGEDHDGELAEAAEAELVAAEPGAGRS